ncbi:uncharacterized protein LOC143229608 [Tachypleus tridentatus]|uniref:uncharacterized protein LOC143229608 n=1 Tax=Tachypleus tridentatus TaxID=6853 RepID=UPI003FD101AF
MAFIKKLHTTMYFSVEILFLCLVLQTLLSEGNAEEILHDKSFVNIPCEFGFSGWKDANGHIYGISNNVLWWYNSTTGMWTHQRVSEELNTSVALNIQCRYRSDYLIVSDENNTFIVNIDAEIWQQVTFDDGFVSLLHAVTWCTDQEFIVLDLWSEFIYRLDVQKAKWIKMAAVPQEMKNLSHPQEYCSHGFTWASSSNTFFAWLADIPYGRESLWRLNTSSFILSLEVEREYNLETTPPLSSRPITWTDSDDTLWVWVRELTGEEVWKTNQVNLLWKQVFVTELSGNEELILKKSHLAWPEEDKICILVSKEECTDGFIRSKTFCRLLIETNNTYEAKDVGRKYSKSTEFPNINSATQVLEPVKMYNHLTVTSPDVTPKELKGIEHDPSWHPKFDLNSSRKPNISLLTERKEPTVKPLVSRVPEGSWHQEHSSVFGAVVFFGTSITIFVVVGMIWCIRRCVHFPKEALLLQDSLSVRYTAIPDTIA